MEDKIPLVDLRAQHDSIKDELENAINSVVAKSQFIGGDERNAFEKDFAAYCKKDFCIGASNGSTALFTALKCLGVKEGDEVIVPANTFVSTASAVSMCGAKPVFSDVNEDDFLINVDLIESRITPNTKAIIPVHLYGAVCDMDRIQEIAEKHSLLVLEDCAQSPGSERNGKRVPIGKFGCFSFFPGKILGAMGDAGAIVSSDKDFAERCGKFVNHGRSEKYYHDTIGFNFRLSNLQAAVLNVKLKHIDSWMAKRNALTQRYEKLLGDLSPSQKIQDSSFSGRYVHVIRSDKRDALQEFLKARGIEAIIHYPVPLHLQPVFSDLGYKLGDLPVAEKLTKQILSIPLYPELSEEKQTKVVEAIREFYDS